MERCGRAWGIRFMCDGLVASEACNSFVLRKFIRAQLRHGKHTDLHEVMEMQKAGEGEWMYQLDSNEKSDTFRCLNAAVTSIYTNELDTARRHLTEHGKPCQLTKALLDYAARTGSAPDPVDIFAQPSLYPTATAEAV
eukprot:TRINITY_DN612_c2_g2_i1.p2 TRINITY_DN612_c2_g2~~TRINITY_DN612_c2_g2_i1.p2  ORF type:complete len:162 (+),score=68.67 TRINITY_DN612_c2_g2_i1:74-487(+)